MADMGIARGDFYLGNVWRKTEKKTEAAPKGLPRFHGGEGGIRFSAEKPRRLQGATGALPRAGFRIPPQKTEAAQKGCLVFMAEKEGFEFQGVHFKAIYMVPFSPANYCKHSLSPYSLRQPFYSSPS